MPQTPSFRRPPERSSKRFIIKLQASLYTNRERQRVLVHNRDKTIQYEENISEAVQDILKGRLKAYFWARLSGTELEILEEAPTQEW